MEVWLRRLTEQMAKQGLDPSLIRTRTLDLITLDTCRGYGKLEEQHAEIIPNLSRISFIFSSNFAYYI